MEGKIKENENPTPIYKGKYKKYSFNDTSKIFLRFTPKSKPLFLLQKFLDAIILGIMAVLFYNFGKEIFQKIK